MLVSCVWEPDPLKGVRLKVGGKSTFLGGGCLCAEKDK